ncbi:MAG: GNAT family N-acetyltransferase [Thermodesulfobacteriota bacterium]|nr:GNAT family N-acetyltransferase [Thermodesulfobacteriota bacterium]
MADYTGFLCSSEYEEKAMSAFAYYIKRKIKWERFRLNGVLDERLERFLLEFDSKEFDTVELTQTGCPYINLPSSWDQYLTASLGPKTRRNVRRSFTEMENVDDLTVTVADKTNLVPQVDALLALWQKRWGSKQRNYLDHIHNVFESCHHNDCLRIMLLWDMNTPVAGVASFPDRHRQTIFEFFNCYNASYTQIRSPGQLAVAHNIRYAIDHGFQKYDFLRGDEKYKYALGAEERYASNVIILRKALGTKLRILADRGLARIERFKAFE